MIARSDQVRAVYTKHGLAFDAQRPKSLTVELPWLRRFASLLPIGGRVLDLGCGAGEPIAGWFLRQGYDVAGVDFAQPMLQLAQERFPQSAWHLQDMRSLSLGGFFDGIIGWDSFFHLSPSEQPSVFRRMANLLRPPGVLMLTLGPRSGEVEGTVDGAPVYHASLSPDAYRHLLAENNLRELSFVIEDPEANHRTILLAQKL
ncbi:MAG: class I SAM-dependent methyltransferase [Pseudomonadota bacterium]